MYEGGIREPFLIAWPGVVRPGGVEDTPVISTDFYPTLLDLAGLPAEPAQHLDGVSLAPLLLNDGPIKRRDLFWHYPHYSNQGGFPGGVIRSGNWKLIERYEDGRTHLFNLDTDIHERSDWHPETHQADACPAPRMVRGGGCRSFLRPSRTARSRGGRDSSGGRFAAGKGIPSTSTAAA